MSTQDLSSIANVVVEVSPAAAPRSNFNSILIIGSNGVAVTNAISANERCRLYTSLSEMLTDGFTINESEYLAASKFVKNFYNYFGNGAAFRIYIGVKEVGETYLQAIEACRSANAEWYVGIAPDAVKSDHEAIADWSETAIPNTIYAVTTNDADVLNATAGNLALFLKNNNYNNTICQYSSDLKAIASIMGYAMGQNNLVGSVVANSSYTLMHKQETGVTVENLTSFQVQNLTSNNCNVYLNYADFYNIFQNGVMSNGRFFDEVVQLHMFSNRIQLAVMDLLYANDKIPQTDAGATQIINAIHIVCEQFRTVGFIGAGVWSGLPVLNLNTGDSLPLGYSVQAESVAFQSDADRQARKSPPIYVAIKLTGAVHSILIQVNVNR